MSDYVPQTWHDIPFTDTPITAARLQHIENGIEAVDAALQVLSGAYGLAPDSNGTDDTAALQSFLNAGGELVFRSGQTWLVDGAIGLFPVSGSRIIIEPGATLQIKTNALDLYRLFNVGGNGAVHDVTIEGEGTLLGDLATHTGSTGQYGHLLYLTDGSDFHIHGPLLLKEAWGDGIYVGGSTDPVEHVLIDGGVRIDDCRREGLAVFNAADVDIDHIHITNIGALAHTLGLPQAPGSGIDIEPNAGDSVVGIRIDSPYIEAPVGCGIYVSPNPGTITDVRIVDPRIKDAGLSTDSLTTYQWNGIHIAATLRPVIINPHITGCGYDSNVNGSSGAIYLRSTQRAVIKGGYLQNNRGRGLFGTGATFTDIIGVTIQENDRQGITLYQCNDSLVTNARFLDNIAVPTTTPHLAVQQCSRVVVKDNVFRGTKGNYWLRTIDSGNDNVIVGNIGLATAPASGAYSDEVTDTYASRNFTKGTATVTAWSPQAIESGGSA